MAPLTISATDAKLQFGAIFEKVKAGTPVIIEKNATPQMVWISIDDYEDYLETKDTAFQNGIEKQKKALKKGKLGTLNDLYAIHRATISKEAKK